MSCGDCTRRQLIQGIGLVAATAALGCGGDGGDPGTDAAVAGTGFEMCGANVCLDLTHPANATLVNVNGSRTINIPGDKIIIVRTSTTEFAVLARTCTHNGCTVAYRISVGELVCPCHGSQFALDGSVTKTPANRALKVYQSMFDDPTQTLTIVV